MGRWRGVKSSEMGRYSDEGARDRSKQSATVPASAGLSTHDLPEAPMRPPTLHAQLRQFVTCSQGRRGFASDRQKSSPSGLFLQGFETGPSRSPVARADFDFSEREPGVESSLSKSSRSCFGQHFFDLLCRINAVSLLTGSSANLCGSDGGGQFQFTVVGLSGCGHGLSNALFGVGDSTLRKKGDR